MKSNNLIKKRSMHNNCALIKPNSKKAKFLDYLEMATLTDLSVNAICEQAGISRRYYYQLLEDKSFIKAISERCLAGFEFFKPQLKRVILENAMKPDGAKDRALAAQCAGMVQSGTNVNVGIGITNNPPNVTDQITDPAEALHIIDAKIKELQLLASRLRLITAQTTDVELIESAPAPPPSADTDHE